MELSRNTGNVSVELATFLDRHEYTLPSTVKIADGFCGTDYNDTLDADQILVFYKVERQKVVMALDEFCQEICVQQNSTTKVHLLPLKCNRYNTVEELLTAQTPFILVLEDILSVGIVSGSKLKLLSDQRSVPNHLKCQVVNRDEFRDVLLPLHLTGKFLPLLDVSDFYLDEVLSQNQLPMYVRFVSESSRTSDQFTTKSLTSLGNIRLSHKTEVVMVFAASFENELSLYLFPKSLDINVACGFKVTPETSRRIKECRKALQISQSSLTRIDNVLKGSFYFTATPVRRFNFQSLQKIPPLPLPRFKRGTKSTLPEEKLCVNIEEPTRRDRVSPTSNCDMSGNFTDSTGLEEVNACSAVSEITNEVIYTNEITATSEVPALPSKTRSGENKRKDAKLESLSRPVPKPRKRKEANVGSRDISKNSQMARTQWQGERVVNNNNSAQRPKTPSAEHDFDEIFPELPPKPIFLQPLQIGNEEEESPTSQEDSPPPLPPKNGEKTYPEEQHNENDVYLEPIKQGETPPPTLPPRNKSFGEDLAYKVVDLTDWKKFEEYGAYAEVKDDGRVFKQKESRIFDTKDYLFMKGQNPEAETSYEEMQQHLRPREAGKETKEAQQAEEESSEDDEPYEEIDDSYVSSKRESELEMNTEERKKADEVKTPTKNLSSNKSSSHNANCSSQTSREKAAITSRPVNNKDTWISARREDDCMDFKDIEQFFKLRKQLDAARAQVEDLKKHVAVKDQDPTKTTGIVPDPSDRMTPSFSSSNDGDSQHLDNNSTDENRNVLVSTKTFCENVHFNSENGKGCELGSEKITRKENLNSISLVAKSIIPEKTGPIAEELRMSNSDISGSDDNLDDDAYEECHDREYVNQEITVENNSTCYVNVDKEEQSSGDFARDGNEPIYYNTVEMEASTDDTLGYLQLVNSSDEDEDVYVNVDAQDSNRDNVKELFEIKELTNDPSTFAVSSLGDNKDVFGDSEPPPLPPKQRSTSTSLHDYET